MSTIASLEPGEHRISCPSCGRGPTDKTFGVTVEHTGAAVGHCFRCEYVETHRPDKPAAYRPGKAPARPVAALKRETLSEWGSTLWNACKPLRGTVGEQYLQARNCVLPPVDGDLRFCAELRHPSGHTGPALVALVTHAETKVPMTLHETWITASGKKADCDTPRMLLSGHRKAGGVIRLWPDDCVTYGLGIAEGIETSLSLAHVYKPVWACIDAGNLAALPVLSGIETLVIAADHDDAGIKAANACATRWTEAGCEVFVMQPDAEGSDLNDLSKAAA